MKTAKVTFRVTQGHWQLCHSLGHTFSYYCSIVTMSLSCTISELLSRISQNLKRSRYCDHAHLRDCLSIRRLTFHMANQCTKFEVSTLSHSRDILGGLKI